MQPGRKGRRGVGEEGDHAWTVAILRLGRRRKRVPHETSTRAVVRQEENGDAIEADVKEGVDAKDDVVGRCCQHRACGDGVYHGLMVTYHTKFSLQNLHEAPIIPNFRSSSVSCLP